MLSLFPSLLAYEQLGITIVRIVLGVTVLYFGYKRIRNRSQDNNLEKIHGVGEILIAGLLIIGLYVQLVAILLSIMLVIKLAFKIKDRAVLTDGVNYYLLMLAMSLSLIFMGAGWLAFDMPL